EEVLSVVPLFGDDTAAEDKFARAKSFLKSLIADAEPEEEPGPERLGKQKKNPKKKRTPPRRPRIVLPPDTPAKELSAHYAKGLRSLRNRSFILLFLSLVTLYLSLANAQLLPALPYLDQFNICVYANAGILILAFIVGWDVPCAGFKALFHLRPAMTTVAAFTCLIVLADAGTLVFLQYRPESLPFFAPATLILTFHLWGIYRKRAALRISCHTAGSVSQPYIVTADPDKWDNETAFQKRTARPDGFGTQIQMPDFSETVQAKLAPILILVSILFALLATVFHGHPELVFWALSAIFSAASSLGACLCFSLPYLSVATKLGKIGAAFAGWAGVSTSQYCDRILLDDYDLYPPGTIKLHDFSVFEGVTEQRLISFTTSVLSAAGGGLTPIFQALARSANIPLLDVQDLVRHNDGLSAQIHGKRVLVGTVDFLARMKVNLPSVLTKQTLFCAVDGVAIGEFILHYRPHTGITPALFSLFGNRITPILIARNFHITQDLLDAHFHIPTDKMIIPDMERRTTLAESQPNQSFILAVLCREGLTPYSTSIAAARRLCVAARLNTMITCIGSAVGVLLAFFLAGAAALTALNALSMSAFLLLWLIPIFLILGWVNQF
ncbi:MAG: hypothetical protein RR053_02340, partial [Evtepia sp.]